MLAATIIGVDGRGSLSTSTRRHCVGDDQPGVIRRRAGRHRVRHSRRGQTNRARSTGPCAGRRGR